MAKYCSVERDRIVIRPLAFLLPLGIAFIAMFVVLSLVMLYFATRNTYTEKAPYSLILMTPLFLACIPFFLYSRRQIIFELSDHSIYRKTWMGKKRLLGFEEVGDIQLKQGFGFSYRLKKKGDRYGKGILLSSAFSGTADKDKIVFDQEVLPPVHALLAQHPAVAVPAAPALFEAGVLDFYSQHDTGYLLKRKGVIKYLPGLILVVTVWCFSLYRYVTVPVHSGMDEKLTWIPLIPLLLLTGVFTKKIVFDLQQQKIRLYRFGLPFLTYDMADFAGLAIVRKTHKGMYNGTDVRMKFNKPSGRQKGELTLLDFNKTAPIENFIGETQFLLDKMVGKGT